MSTALELAGAVLLVAAAALVAVPFGLAVAGVLAIGFGYLLEDEGDE